MKAASSPSPTYDDLKTAKQQADLARALVPALDSVAKLSGDVRFQLTGLTDLGDKELKDYRTALADHTAGYAHLLKARALSETITGIDSDLAVGRTLLAQVLDATNALENALRTAQSAVTARQMDKAYAAIQSYRSFAPEEVRINNVIDAAYGYHFEQAKKAEEIPEWERAVTEYGNAATIRDTSEVRDALKNAREQLVVAQNKAAAENAKRVSKSYEDNQQIIEAYQVLLSLTPAQQAYVQEELARLKQPFIDKSSDEANSLKKLHDKDGKINGIGDEKEIETAYRYLQRDFQLSQDESYSVRAQSLAKDLSVYLLTKAKSYLNKPNGSGSELGWTYLQEAEALKAPNFSEVRDAETRAIPTHQLRSRLSVRVHFLDQSSSQGNFANQLEAAVISGLETSATPVKVVKAEDQTAVDPDYRLDGDVLRDKVAKTVSEVSKASKYRSGDRQEANAEWVARNQALDALKLNMNTLNSLLQGQTAKGEKSQAAATQNKIQEMSRQIAEAEKKRDAVPEKNSVQVIADYRYIERTTEVTGAVELRFRIGSVLDEGKDEEVPVSKSTHQTFVVDEGVKPEDTEDIKSHGIEPDLDSIKGALESEAKDELIAKVRSRIDELPMKIYKSARSLEDQSDLEGAGEGYLRFLKLTQDTGSDEQRHAKAFLLDNFNMRINTSSTP